MARKVAVLPIVGMVMAECAQAGRMILGKAAMSNGISSFVFVLYSNAIACLILLPSSSLFHRSSERPPLTLSIVSGFFLLGLFGCLGQSFCYAGINLSSPTLGTAMLNLVPGLTFILAIIFSYSTVAKSMGTIVSIGGAFIVTCYKGPLLLKALPSVTKSSHQVLLHQSNWVLGGLLMAVDCATASSWLIVQALILKKYPAKLIVVFFHFFFSTILSSIVSVVMERDPSAWSLNSNIRLIAVLFSRVDVFNKQGILGNAFEIGVTAWCLHETCPVFVAIFAPLGIVIAAAASVVCFGDALDLGIVLGAAIIATGFYAVIWGKAHEEIKKVEDKENCGSASSSQKAMLSANPCTLTSKRLFKKYTYGSKRNLKLFTIRASSDDSDCNTEECAPEKEVGMVSLGWLAGEKTKVAGTFPPWTRGRTGYVEKDTAAQTDIYSVEASYLHVFP
ncbi:hypothetical protein NC651_000416 [Populus alba x Populus x berolinensis]|nr:hypothetical protein NC651_000416 [Populus alba x Populus x berolinensis]